MKRSTGHLKHIIGPAIGIAGLVWVLHDIHLSNAVQHMAGIRWGYVACAIAIDFTAVLIQGLRWALILQPVVSVRPLAACNALLIGYFTNLFLPLRAGEVVRVYVLSRKGRIDSAVGMASIFEERILDGIVLALIIAFLIGFHFPLPDWIRKAMTILVGLILLGGLLLFALGASGRLFEASAASGRRRRLVTPLLSVFGRLGRGLVSLYHPETLAKAFLLSMPFWLLQGGVMYAMFLAYNLSLSFLAALTILIIINIGIMVPNTPGNVGTYQFFCVLGLSLYGVDKTTAAGFSIVIFVLLTIPILLSGFWLTTRSGFSLTTLRSDVHGSC